MLEILNIAEPGALIGFAGNVRVIKETIGKDLPEGFQLTSEFLLEKGFIRFYCR